MNSEVTETTDTKEQHSLAAIAASNEESRSYSVPTAARPCGAPDPRRISHSSAFRGWILFDSDCSSCAASARRFKQTFRRRGFLFLPLQTKWVLKRLGLKPGAPLEQMHVLTSDGRDIAGADAVIFLARQIWWAWPIARVGQLRRLKSLLDRAYRWVAAHRGRGHLRCCAAKAPLIEHRVPVDVLKPVDTTATPLSRQSLLRRWPASILIVILPMDTLLLRDRLAPWEFMWLITAAIFFGCKWLTAWGAQRPDSDVRLIPMLGYFFAWPGMEAKKFLVSKTSSPELDRLKQSSSCRPRPHGRTAMANILLGLVLFFGIARLVQQPVLAGWIGMSGLALILHFGLFRLLALGWRKAGIDVEPIMDSPWRSKSIGEFWGRRWNSAFNLLAFQFVSRPIARAIRKRRSGEVRKKLRGSSSLHAGTVLGTLAAFLVSGLTHELVISFPARAGYGLPTAYFLLQGAGILLERARPRIRGRVFTIVMTAIPAFWLFHPPFIHRVILPFMKTVGAS